MARRIVDLSLDIFDGYPAHPADVQVQMSAHATHAKHGFQTTRLTLCTHTATHMDAPYHFLPDGNTIDQIDLQKCIGPAEVLDLTRRPLQNELRIADLLPYEARIQPGSRILLRTDWDRVWGTPRFYTEGPDVNAELAQWLADKGIVLIGVQAFGVHTTDYERVHKIFLTKKIVIVEALAHLDQLRRETVELVVLPLRIRGGDGSPVRALAIEEE